ncbi:MAG TPA: DUF4268 domain-containing protein [Actinomycetota bacterium]|nr:DUF4268 domain-containing protein [Actinomycetota bacterium]
MSADMEIERLGLGRLERLDLHSFWGEDLPDLMPWFSQNLDLLSQTLGIEITPLRREIHIDQGSLHVLGTDPQGRLVIVENQLEPTRDNHLGELIINASSLESAAVVWVSPRFPEEHRRTLEWLNDRTDDKVDFFAVEIGLVRIGRSLPAPVLDVVVQPRGWRQPGRRVPVMPGAGFAPPRPASSPVGEPPPPSPSHMPPPASTQPSSQLPPAPPPMSSPPAPPRPSESTLNGSQPPPLASDKDGGFATAEVRHRFFETMFEAVARRKPGFRVPKFGYENWVGFAAGPFGFYDVAFTANGAVRAGVYLDMQERTATKRLFDDLYAERLGIETAVGRILSWERLDDRRASRIVDYREVRDLANLEERQAAGEWAAEAVVKLMDALDNRLRQTAQILLSRVQGGI